MEAVPDSFAWKTGESIIDLAAFDEPDWIALKDPSIIRHEGRWHLFCTLRGRERSHATVYASFESFEDAGNEKPVVLPNHDGYFCAPQVFYYGPHKKWYLVCQAKSSKWNPEYQAAYATTSDISDPNSWTPLKPMGVKRPEIEERSPFLDFWIIREGDTIYNFFTSDNGQMWRTKTTVETFPVGWAKPELAYKGDIFEASHIYRLPDGSYVNLIEAQAKHDRRYIKILRADSLAGEWGPWRGDDEFYASVCNILYTGETWADSISHGELVRSGIDEYLEASINAAFVFQGVMMTDRAGKSYGNIPWKLGVLHPAPAKPVHSMDDPKNSSTGFER